MAETVEISKEEYEEYLRLKKLEELDIGINGVEQSLEDLKKGNIHKV